MDLTDLRICSILLMNSRIPYRDIADKLGLSVQAVHRRVQTMVEDEVIRGFTARISAAQLGAVIVSVFGTTESSSPNEIASELAKHDSTESIHASGDFMTIGAILRDHSELESYVDFVRDHALMPKPNVGILGTTMTVDKVVRQEAYKKEPLTALDYRIVESLHQDSRKEVTKISDELGVSVATITKHLEKLMANGSVEMSILFFPGASSGVISMASVKLVPKADKIATALGLAKTLGDHLIGFGHYSNIPDLLVGIVWTSTLKELRDLQESLQKIESVDSVETLVFQRKYMFETWRDKLLREKASA